MHLCVCLSNGRWLCSGSSTLCEADGIDTVEGAYVNANFEHNFKKNDTVADAVITSDSSHLGTPFSTPRSTAGVLTLSGYVDCVLTTCD